MLGQCRIRMKERDEIGRAVFAVMQIDEPLVEDDADRRLAISERDDPDPVAESGVVIRGQTARADVARGEITGTRRDVVDVPDAVPPAPDRGDRMLVIALDEIEAPPEEVDASRRIEEPAAAELANFVTDFDRQLVVEVVQLDVARFRGTQQLRTFIDGGLEQVLVERVATQLKRRHRTAKESATFRRIRVTRDF